MTTEPAHARTWVGAPALTLVVAVLVGVHLVDDSFVQPEPGTSPGDHLTSGLVPLAGLLVTAAVGVRARPGVRAITAGIIGASAVIAGLEGWQALRSSGPSRDDYTGIIALVAGTILLVSTVVHLWRIRSRGTPRLRRYLGRGLVAVVGLLLALQVGYPMANAYVGTHLSSPVPSGADLGHPYEEVEVAADGDVRLRAWYLPSRNRAVVVTYPGRQEAQRYARFLASHGYGVLMVDRRGHGGSTGDPNSYGWGEYRDIAAAVTHLQSRNDVDPDRIGGLGFSVGGEVLLETAARTSGLHAVVAEGAGSRSIRELRHLGAASWFSYPLVSVATVSTAVFADRLPPPDLVGLMSRTPPRPVLLIQAETGQGGEELASLYAAAAGGTAELWRVPGSTHVGGLDAAPDEYEQRVIDFFDRALLGSRP
jgi:fermentation-respiration switch protein FrsA (DUF1100 family)